MVEYEVITTCDNSTTYHATEIFVQNFHKVLDEFIDWQLILQERGKQHKTILWVSLALIYGASTFP